MPGPKKGSRPRKGVTAPSRLYARERALKAMELRKAGVSYPEIADTLGYATPAGARNAVVRLMEAIPKDQTIDLREVQIERLNHMLKVLWPKINAGNEGAINTGLRIMAQIDGLTGTAAPQQVDVHHSGGATVQHEGVLVIEGDKDEFIRRLQSMALGTELQDDETKDDSDDGVIEAKVVEEPKKELPSGEVIEDEDEYWFGGDGIDDDGRTFRPLPRDVPVVQQGLDDVPKRRKPPRKRSIPPPPPRGV